MAENSKNGVAVSDASGPMHASVDWVIVGGESGSKARPMHPQWARDLRDQCAEAGVPFLFKQWGEWAPGVCSDDPECSVKHVFEGDARRVMSRVGKKHAGRLLDGAQHDGYPIQPPRVDASRKKAKCLRDLEFDNNLQGPCSAGQCQFPDCVESPKGGDKE